jgi:hypothetical protein
MAPLNLALFNLREVTKHMLLLEEQLSKKDNFCSECIKKRFLLMEAIVEEAIQPHTRWASIAIELAIQIRRWQMAFSDGVQRLVICEKVRVRRKALIDIVFRPFK